MTMLYAVLNKERMEFWAEKFTPPVGEEDTNRSAISLINSDESLEERKETRLAAEKSDMHVPRGCDHRPH